MAFEITAFCTVWLWAMVSAAKADALRIGINAIVYAMTP